MECSSFQSVTHMAVNTLTNFRNNVKDWDSRETNLTVEEQKAMDEKPALLNRIVAQVGYSLSAMVGVIETIVSTIVRLVLLPISYMCWSKAYSFAKNWNESAQVSTAKSFANVYFNMVADVLPTRTDSMTYARLSQPATV